MKFYQDQALILCLEKKLMQQVLGKQQENNYSKYQINIQVLQITKYSKRQKGRVLTGDFEYRKVIYIIQLLMTTLLQLFLQSFATINLFVTSAIYPSISKSFIKGSYYAFINQSYSEIYFGMRLELRLLLQISYIKT